MNFYNTAFIYILVWWVTLFTVLPLNIERHDEKGKGYDPGAPKHPQLKKKLILNSIIAAIVVFIIWMAVKLGFVHWHQWFGTDEQ